MIRKLALSFILLGAVDAAEGYDAIRFLEPIKTGGMAKPISAASSASRLYVLDEKKSALFIYDLLGQLLKTAGKPGVGKGALSAPKGVAIGPQGQVYVADTGNSRVQIFDADGEFVGSFGSRGSEPGLLKNPESVAVGNDGRVYVADTGNDRVQVFTGQGILLFQFGESGKEPGYFRLPKKIVVDASDHVYVLDSGNSRIQRFDSSATFAKELSLIGNDFTVDPYGFIYTLDAKNGKVIEQDPDGAVIGKFGSVGTGTGQYKRPEGIGLAPGGGLLVVDTGNGRIHRVELASKLKVSLLSPNLETKILASGPSRAWDVPAEALAPLGSQLYAWLPKEGQFVLLDEEGKEKARFGSKLARGPAATRGTRGFAASQKLGLFVSDTPNDRLQQFALDGTWTRNIAESAGLFESKKKEGRVKDPRGVAINDQGTVYVADAGNRRIDAFSPEGVYLFGIGPTVGSHELMEPVAVAWDRARFVYFIDKGLKKIFKAEPSGAFISSWGEPGSGPGQFEEPAALAFDGNNYLYVLDAKLKRVSVYSKDGRWMTDLFSGGLDEQSLSEPVALAVQGPRLLIADRGKGKIVSFDLHPILASPRGLAGEAKEGIVTLSWQAVADPWTDRYLVYRSSQAQGPFVKIGHSETTKFADSDTTPYSTFFYRVATQAKTKDVGPVSPVFEIYAAGAFNRPPVEISTITIGNIFSANYKWYLKNPIGSVVVTNNVNVPFQNVKVTFRLKDFMDFGYDTEVKKIAAQETVEVPLIATLNNKILDVTEDTPIQAEFTLTYFENGKQQAFSLTKPLRVYSRNAITWDKPERIANFITPKDPPVLEFARQALREAPSHPKAEALNANVVAAVHLWDALSHYGLGFFTNPSNPYDRLSEDPNFPVDYTQFPRETLKRKSGQCDDLTTLLISMLDATKVRSAVLDYPGHMALLFDTEASDLTGAGLPEELLVKWGGTYWVPLEATMIGKPFMEAVRRAAYSYHAENAKGKATIIDVRQAWQTFEPATMPASAWSPEPPPAAALEARFAAAVESLFDDRYKALRKLYEAELAERPADAETRVQLGLLEAQAGRLEVSAEEFSKALIREPQNPAALNNLGNLAYLAGDYAAAAKRYEGAVAADSEDPDLWMNLARVHSKLKDRAKTQEAGAKAVALDGGLSSTLEALLKGI